jgi:hypothetical protein
MSLRYKGALLSATPPTVNATGYGSAKGIWTMQQQFQYEGAGTWPSPFTPTYVEDVFSTYLYTGNGSTQTITNGLDLSTKGGVVWVKSRSNGLNNTLSMTGLSSGYTLETNTENAPSSSALFTGFTTTGFGVTTSGGAATNSDGFSSNNYVSWSFVRQPKFFDVVTFTGNGTSNQAIAHNLQSVPGFIVIRKTSGTGMWPTYHRSLGRSYFQRLNSTTGGQTVTNIWGTSDPTDTNFYVSNVTNPGTGNPFVESGETYIAMLFAHDAGGFGDSGTDSIIKCGSVTATGGNVEVDLGWEPQWVLVKNASASENWRLLDNMRGISNANTKWLFPNAISAETDNSAWNELTSTGFRLLGWGASGNNYIYIAIRRGPMKTPTDATKVFKTIFRSGTSATATVTGVGFAPDTALIKNTLGNANSVDWSHNFFDKLRNPGYRLSTTFTDPEDTATSFITSFDQDGMTLPSTGYTATNGSSYTYVNHFFKRAPKFFDTVCYTGTGTARTINHNLGIAPELMIVRRRNDYGSWYMWGGNMPMTNTMFLEQTSASADNAAYFNDTAPTSSVFSVNSAANTSGTTYIAYLFGSCPGVSKVGTYTGNGGTAQNIDCGFTNGARFVLIKSTGTGNWFVFNSVRGIVDAGDRYLMLNSVDAEDNSLDIIDPYSAGFAIANTTYVNTNGVTYIYLAIA